MIPLYGNDMVISNNNDNDNRIHYILQLSY